MKFKIYYFLKDTVENRDCYRTGSISKMLTVEQSFTAETDDIKKIIAEVRTDKNKKYIRYEKI